MSYMFIVLYNVSYACIYVYAVKAVDQGGPRSVSGSNYSGPRVQPLMNTKNLYAIMCVYGLCTFSRQENMVEDAPRHLGEWQGPL